MDPISCFWLNGSVVVFPNSALKRAENNNVWRMVARNNVAKQFLWGSVASDFSTLFKLTYRRQNSFQAVEALFITQGLELN